MNLQRKLHEEHKARRLRMSGPRVVTTVTVISNPAPPMPDVVKRPISIFPKFVYSRAIGPIQPAEGDLVVQRDAAPMIARRIVQDVCAKHRLTLEEIISDRRSTPLVRARQEAMWRISKETTWSLPRIGKFFANRDHTTVLHAIRRHAERLQQGA